MASRKGFGISKPTFEIANSFSLPSHSTIRNAIISVIVIRALKLLGKLGIVNNEDEKIVARYSKAWLTDSARKKIHAITVSVNVKAILKKSFNEGSNRPWATVPRLLRFLFSNNNGIK